MKKVLTAMCILFICACASKDKEVQTNGNLPSPSMMVDTVINTYFGFLENVYEARLETQIKKVLDKKNFYRGYLLHAFRESKGMKIDFISQAHIAANNEVKNGELPSLLIESQKKISQLLRSNNYGVIGWENSALNEVTPKSWINEQNQFLKNEGKNPFLEVSDFYKLTPEMTIDDAVVTYWILNPDARIVGNQDPDLWALNLSAKKTPGVNPEISVATTCFRSYIALAKVIDYMQKKHIRTGVVVLGAKHTPEFPFLRDVLGLKMEIFDTTGLYKDL